MPAIADVPLPVGPLAAIVGVVRPHSIPLSFLAVAIGWPQHDFSTSEAKNC